jgi:nucleotide-binding universal stress UspA family protein
MKCNCILAGVDLGPDTEMIVSYAACFSTGVKAPVRLLYVIDFLLTPPAYLMPYIEEEERRDEAELKRWHEVLQRRGVSSVSGIMMGRLHEAFLTALREYSPGLLIIGHKSHVLRPSSSERLIKSLAMPMLVVRGGKAEQSTDSVIVKKILCAVDFSESSVKALDEALGYADAFSAELQVAHVVPSHYLRDRWTQWEHAGEGDRDQFNRDVQADAETALAGIVEKSGVQSSGELLHGDPAEMICSYARQGDYDLIIMGARGLSYLEGMLIGSTTESVLRSSPCPVLIIH